MIYTWIHWKIYHSTLSWILDLKLHCVLRSDRRSTRADWQNYSSAPDNTDNLLLWFLWIILRSIEWRLFRFISFWTWKIWFFHSRFDSSIGKLPETQCNSIISNIIMIDWLIFEMDSCWYHGKFGWSNWFISEWILIKQLRDCPGFVTDERMKSRRVIDIDFVIL
jgi:hypothetical protein